MELLKTNVEESGTKLPPRKCRIWATVGDCGVGASGSTTATTKGPALPWPRMVNIGGPAVAVEQGASIPHLASYEYKNGIPFFGI